MEPSMTPIGVLIAKIIDVFIVFYFLDIIVSLTV